MCRKSINRRFSKRPLAGSGDDNLAHAIMEWAAESEPSLLSLGDDLPRAAEASRQGLEDIKKKVQTLERHRKSQTEPTHIGRISVGF